MNKKSKANQQPFFTIVIPCFNVEKYIVEAVNSIERQGFENYEILCVDDGSIDGTLKTITELAQNNLRISIILSQNRGPGSARNIGIRAAKGKHILFLDGDDFFSEGLFRALEKEASDNQLQVILFGYRLFDKKLKTVRSFEEQARPNFESYTQGTVFPGCPGKCISREFLISNKLFLDEEIKVEVIDFIFRLMLASTKTSFIPGHFYNRRLRDNSESRTPSEFYIESYIHALQNCYKALLKNNLGNVLPFGFKLFCFKHLLNLLKKTEFAETNVLRGKILIGVASNLKKAQWQNDFCKFTIPNLTTKNNGCSEKYCKDFIKSFQDENSEYLPRDEFNLVERLYKLNQGFADLIFPKGTARRNALINIFDKSRKSNNKILVYPEFRSLEEYSNFVYRLGWYISPFVEEIKSINIFSNTKFDKLSRVPSYFDDTINEKHIYEVLEKINIYQATEANIIKECKNSDIVLSYANGIEILSSLQLHLKKDVLIWDISPDSNNGALNILSLRNRIKTKNSDGRQESRNKFLSYLDKKQTLKTGYIFGTGPSLSMIYDRDISDVHSIICNSMIRNKKLVEKLNPLLTVFGDPIFHAGCSSYAGNYRKDLCSFINDKKCLAVTSDRDIHVYKKHLDKNISEKIISLPFDNEIMNINYQLDKYFRVATTSNILTLYLLPIAGFLFDEIYIAGCDGRPLEQNDYYWGHDKTVQYNDKMPDIQLAHPGFFSIDYNEYYLKHCYVLEKWISTLESAGKRVVNLTPSYIPALAKRSLKGVGVDDFSQCEEIEKEIINCTRKYDWHNKPGTYVKSF